MTLLWITLALFGAALVAPFLQRLTGRWTGVVLAAAPAAAFAVLGWHAPRVQAGDFPFERAEWFGSLGVALDFRLDGLSLLMGLLISGIGAFISLYAAGYLGKHAQAGRFFLYLYAFMGAMLGLVLADNLMLLFVFWELTSITSYLLIGFNHEEKVSRWNALQALLVTGAGGLALLAGFILMADVTGSYSLATILASGDVLREHAWYPAILALVVIGAFTKSAQVPFHFWLPNAMAAPTPVSAFLHSATMVKAGVFLLATLHPVLGQTVAWETLLTGFGALTLLTGAVLGLLQTDLKRILAYTTLAVLGLLVMLLGIGTEMAVKSAMLFLLGHALYKAALFMTAGSVDHEAGTREVTALGGLRAAMPVTAVAAGLAALSKAGFPPFFGFLGKEYVYKTGIELEWLAPLVTGTALVGNALLMALAFKAGIHPFFGRKRSAAEGHVHEAPWTMLAGPVVLALTGLGFGVFPVVLAQPFIEPASSAVAGYGLDFKLALWHGLNLPLLLSALTLAVGLTIYLLRERIWKQTHSFSGVFPYGAEAGYNRLYDALLAVADKQTRLLQSGLLRNYLVIILGSAALLVWIKLALLGWFPNGEIFKGLIRPHEGLLVGVMILAIIGVLVARTRLLALVCLGVVGLGVAILFALFGAPDLAITQLLVEALTVVLFALVIFRLPRFSTLSSRRTIVIDGIFAGLCGATVSLLVLKANLVQIAPSISDKLGEWSYLLAKGKNVVNVILVDFRALDTLGEITVLCIAALGVAALLRVRVNKEGRR